MITPIEPIPFSEYLQSADKKLSFKDFDKRTQSSELENLESGQQPESTTVTVNALFDGAQGNKIQFENIDEDTIIKIIDPETNETIREIPPEELRAMQERMEELTGQFVDQYG